MPYTQSSPDYTSHANSDARREELGHDRVFIRPVKPTANKLDRLVRKLNTNRSAAIAYAVHKALAELENATPAELREAMRLLTDVQERRV